jgi:diguanylate cyclase (GGDEF)-like protein
MVFLGFALLAVFGIADYWTRWELSFSLFYLIPIMLVTWYGARITGIVVSVLSGGVWFFSDITTAPAYSHLLDPYWNAFVRIGICLLVNFIFHSLRESMQRERELSRVDPLTGAKNGRALYEIAGAEIERSRRTGRPIAVAFLDIDNFKEINDSSGHARGDALLRVVAEGLKTHLRISDVVARLGGDEFALLLPETDGPDSLAVVDRMSRRLTDALRKDGWSVTFSIGIAAFGTPPRSVDDMIQRADSLMYQAKNNGKDKIMFKSH